MLLLPKLPLAPPSSLTVAALVSMVSTVMQKRQCEREESWFISVAPTLRFFLPTYVQKHHAQAATI